LNLYRNRSFYIRLQSFLTSLFLFLINVIVQKLINILGFFSVRSLQ
jgi:hypothetical protein